MSDSETTLTGQLLIAMPGMPDSRFAQTVVYLCAHSDKGAMGLVVNKLLDSIDFAELLDQVGVEHMAPAPELAIYYGGPVEPARGFVLHTMDYEDAGTVGVDSEIGLTASVDVLREIASGAGPRRSLLALGYSGWGPGQLESEIGQNGWLHAPADESILFDVDLEDRWRVAIERLGFDLSMLSSAAGRA